MKIKRMAVLPLITLAMVFCFGCGNNTKALSGPYYCPRDNLVLVFDENGTMASPDNTITGTYKMDSDGHMKVAILASSMKFTGSGTRNTDGTLDFVCGSVKYHMIPGSLPEKNKISTDEKTQEMPAEKDETELSFGKATVHYGPDVMISSQGVNASGDAMYSISDVPAGGTGFLELYSSYLQKNGYPASQDDVTQKLYENGDISGTTKVIDTDNFYVIVATDFVSNTGKSYFEYVAVPKSESAGKDTYAAMLFYSPSGIPSETIYNTCADVINQIAGEGAASISYETALNAMKTVYENAGE